MRILSRAVLAALSLVAVAAVALAPARADTLNLTVRAGIEGTLTGSAVIGTPVATLPSTIPINLTNGTGSGQADKLYAARRTLSASATENLDLAGSLTDPLGQSLTFVTVKAIRICAASTNTNNVVVGGAGVNAFLLFSDATDKIAVRPGGCFLWVAPVTGAAVTAGTGDILLVANSGAGTSVSYDVTIVGTSL